MTLKSSDSHQVKNKPLLSRIKVSHGLKKQLDSLGKVIFYKNEIFNFYVYTSNRLGCVIYGYSPGRHASPLGCFFKSQKTEYEEI